MGAKEVSRIPILLQRAELVLNGTWLCAVVLPGSTYCLSVLFSLPEHMVVIPHFPLSHVLRQPFLHQYTLHREPRLVGIHSFSPSSNAPSTQKCHYDSDAWTAGVCWGVAVWGQLPLSHGDFQTWETLEPLWEPLRMNVPEASSI